MGFRALLHLADTVSHLLLSNRRRFRVCSWLSDATRRPVSRTHSRLHMYSLTSRVLVITIFITSYEVAPKKTGVYRSRMVSTTRMVSTANRASDLVIGQYHRYQPSRNVRDHGTEAATCLICPGNKNSIMTMYLMRLF